jgi:hypothetical protein
MHAWPAKQIKRCTSYVFASYSAKEAYAYPVNCGALVWVPLGCFIDAVCVLILVQLNSYLHTAAHRCTVL